MGQIVKRVFFVLFVSLLTVNISAQEHKNFLFDPIPGNESIGGTSGSVIPILGVRGGGICNVLAGACGSIIDTFTSFEGNPATSSLIYGSPAIGFGYTNWFESTSLQSLAYVQTLGAFGYGVNVRFSNAVITSNIDNIEQLAFTTTHVSAALNASYNFIRANDVDGLSIGATAKYSFRAYPLEGQVVIQDSALVADIGLFLNLHALKIIPFPVPNLAVSIYQQNVGFYTNGGLIPGRFNAGFSYRPFEYGFVSFNVALPFDRIDTSPIESLLIYSVGIGITPHRIIEINGGVEISSSQFNITAGFALNISGATIRFTQHFTPLTDYSYPDTFNLSVALRSGSAIQPERQVTVQRLYLLALADFAAQDLDGALRLVNSALRIAPGYQPAIELKNQIRNIQSINRRVNEEQ